MTEELYQKVIQSHPVFTRALPLRQAYLKALAEGLAEAIDDEHPHLIQLTERVIIDTGLSIDDVAVRMDTTRLVLRSRLYGGVFIPKEPSLAATFANTVITMLAEQLPHPPEGL